jgi:hypothetical protein
VARFGWIARGEGRRGGGGSRGVGEAGDERGLGRADGDDLTHVDGRCRLAEGRTRGGSLPLRALIGSIDIYPFLKNEALLNLANYPGDTIGLRRLPTSTQLGCTQPHSHKRPTKTS